MLRKPVAVAWFHKDDPFPRNALPLAAVLAAQALLFCLRLDLLPLWGDEWLTHGIASHASIGGILQSLHGDVHPPLYFLLIHAWMRLPLPWTGIPAMRAFSVLASLASTAVLDRFWLVRWPPARRLTGLILFAFSPCLLLYGRMARSYALQTLFALLAVSLLARWLSEPRAILRWALPALVSSVALLYTHYLPGIAILAGFTLLAWRRLRIVQVALFDAAAALVYTPWLFALAGAVRSWGEGAPFQARYSLSGSTAVEAVVKIGVTLASFTVGETFLPVCLVLVPVAALLAWRGRRGNLPSATPPAFLGIAALVGFVGAARWVTWPFVAARLLWLLPFFLLLVAAGYFTLRPRARKIALAAILISFVSSEVLYFRRENFLNLGYNAPMREIAAELRRSARSGDVVLADGYNGDPGVLDLYLGGAAPLIALKEGAMPEARDAIRRSAGVWVVRNTHDVSPGREVTAMEEEACRGKVRSTAFYGTYATWQRSAMQAVTHHPAPEFYYEVTNCR